MKERYTYGWTDWRYSSSRGPRTLSPTERYLQTSSPNWLYRIAIVALLVSFFLMSAGLWVRLFL